MKWNVFNELYPFDDSNKKALRTALVFGSFVFLFLTIFNPFGLSNFKHPDRNLYLAGYGTVTSICLITSHFVFKYLFSNWYSKKSWTVGKNILFTCFMFFFIGFGNLTFSVYLDFLSFSTAAFWYYQMVTLLVGLFPVIISNIFYYNRRLKKAIQEAAALNQDLIHSDGALSSIELPSKNKSEEFQTSVQELLAIKAVENYVEVYHLKKDELQKTVLRNALKEMEKELELHGVFQKCHRSYLVNLEAVKHFSGNAQGLSLDFGEEIPLQVPVSRSYVEKIKNRLHAKS